jgi:hypothetical protein
MQDEQMEYDGQQQFEEYGNPQSVASVVFVGGQQRGERGPVH